MSLPRPPLQRDPDYLIKLVAAIERQFAQCVKRLDGAIEIHQEAPVHITSPNGNRYRIEATDLGELVLVAL